jgi:hypothetical protein
MGRNLITVPLPFGAVSTRRTSLYLMRGIAGVMIKVGAWGPFQGLTGLAPTRGFLWRSHWTTHASKAINLLYSLTTTLYYNSQYGGGPLKVILTTIVSLHTNNTSIYTIHTTAQWVLASPYIPLENVTLLEPSTAFYMLRMFRKLL